MYLSLVAHRAGQPRTLETTRRSASREPELQWPTSMSHINVPSSVEVHTSGSSGPVIPRLTAACDDAHAQCLPLYWTTRWRE
jgi:hypothetical protein